MAKHKKCSYCLRVEAIPLAQHSVSDSTPCSHGKGRESPSQILSFCKQASSSVTFWSPRAPLFNTGCEPVDSGPKCLPSRASLSLISESLQSISSSGGGREQQEELQDILEVALQQNCVHSLRQFAVPSCQGKRGGTTTGAPAMSVFCVVSFVLAT